MPSRFTAQSGKGVLLVALALVATLLVPSVYTWAVKPQIDPDKGSEKLLDDKATFAYFQRTMPVGQPRPLGIAPVPDALAGKPLPLITKRDGLLWTGAGYINPKNPNALKDVPEDLRGTVVHKAPVGKGFGLSDGVGIIQISKAALSSRPWADIEGEIRRLGGRILTTIPERGVIVAGDNKTMASLVLASFVEASMPYPEAAKLSADIGRMPLISKARANRSDFDLNVRTWHGFDVGGALADVQKIVGKDRASLDVDGLTIKATGTSQEAKRIARIPAAIAPRGTASSATRTPTVSPPPTRCRCASTRTRRSAIRPAPPPPFPPPWWRSRTTAPPPTPRAWRTPTRPSAKR
jgi:hypothetical protein